MGGKAHLSCEHHLDKYCFILEPWLAAEQGTMPTALRLGQRRASLRCRSHLPGIPRERSNTLLQLEQSGRLAGKRCAAARRGSRPSAVRLRTLLFATSSKNHSRVETSATGSRRGTAGPVPSSPCVPCTERQAEFGSVPCFPRVDFLQCGVLI